MADENTPAHLCIVAKAGGLVVVVAAFVVVVLVVMVVGKTCTKLFALSLSVMCSRKPHQLCCSL